MKWIPSTWYGVSAILAFSWFSQGAFAQDPGKSGPGSVPDPGPISHSRTATPLRVSVEGLLKYNSNLDLENSDTAENLKDTFIGEVTGRAELKWRLAQKWAAEAQLSSLANLHQDHSRENWYFSRGRFALRRRTDAGAIELSSELRYFTVPDGDDFDFLRNVALATYRHRLSPLWHIRGGYENIATRYPNSRSFDYTVNGAFVELRHRWSFDLSTYYQLDLHVYKGTASPQDQADQVSSPEDGRRQTVRLGFDWLFGGNQALSGTYSAQADEADLGVNEIGDFEGHEGSQDSEAEFDLLKQKATLLYSVPLSRRLVLSSYNEVIHKIFEDQEVEFEDEDEDEDEDRPEGDPPILQEGRTDFLFLSSTYLRVKPRPRLALKVRYLFRMNASSESPRDYTNHILSVGVDYTP